MINQQIYDEASEFVEMNDIFKLDSVAEGSAGRDDGITKAKRANGNAQVNISRGTAGIGGT